MPDPDVLLLVEATLTDEAREHWLERAFTLYPRLEGAKVADVLGELNSTDAFLPLTEPWWDTHGQALAMELLCDSELLSAAVRLAIIAQADENGASFDALAEAVARAAHAGDARVIDLEHMEARPVPDLYHGPELDAALDRQEGPEKMGVCLTALGTRREAIVTAQMREASFATSILRGEDPDPADVPEGPLGEQMRKGLLELKATVEEAKGEPMSLEDATVLALRTTFGGIFSRGIEVGLNLARNRQEKAREATLVFDKAGDVAEIGSSWWPRTGTVEMVEKVKL